MNKIFSILILLIFCGCSTWTPGYYQSNHNGKYYWFSNDCKYYKWDNNNPDVVYCIDEVSGQLNGKVILPASNEDVMTYMHQKQIENQIAQQNYQNLINSLNNHNNSMQQTIDSLQRSTDSLRYHGMQHGSYGGGYNIIY